MTRASTDVLVGYIEEERGAARPLAVALKQAGLSVRCVVFDGIISDEDVLQRPVDSTHCFVVLWSLATANSAAVKEITSHAIQAWWLNCLILLTLDDTPLPTGLRDVPITALKSASSADIAETIAKIRKIIDEDLRIDQAPLIPVRRRWIVAFSMIGLLVAVATGTAGHLYRSTHSSSLPPRQVYGIGDPDDGPRSQSERQNRPSPLAAPNPGLDESEAARLYKIAADKGNSDAQFKLAKFYELGRGRLLQDTQLAQHYYRLAADQGNGHTQPHHALPRLATREPKLPQDLNRLSAELFFHRSLASLEL